MPPKSASLAGLGEEKARKPVYKLKDGAIDVSVWENEGKDGRFYSVTHHRSYKKGDAWKESGSYGQDDLLVLAKLLELSYQWILLHRPQQRARNQAA
ncbi:MAG: hypothetical protein ACLQVF_28295 [Isosphaeraceae bacterium]